MEKEELLRQLEYINSELKDLKPNDGERSFLCYQKNEIEKELEMIENEGQNQRD